MKTNKMMRIASVLLVAVLLTTCVISGTFAKYVTEGAAATDSARVAKWGVTIDTASFATFANTYAADDGETSITNTVVSTDKVVAPGTTKTLANVTIAGTPEVAVAVDYVATVTLTGFDDYCPIVFTVNGNSYKVGDGGIADATALATKVKEEIEKFSAEYEAGTDLGTKDDAVTVSWAWAFETGANDGEKATNNVKDTALGNAAAEGNAAEISLSLTATVTQID